MFPPLHRIFKRVRARHVQRCVKKMSSLWMCYTQICPRFECWDEHTIHTCVYCVLALNAGTGRGVCVCVLFWFCLFVCFLFCFFFFFFVLFCLFVLYFVCLFFCFVLFCLWFLCVCFFFVLFSLFCFYIVQQANVCTFRNQREKNHLDCITVKIGFEMLT